MRKCGVCASALGAALNDMGKEEWKEESDVALPYHQEEPKTRPPPTIPKVTWQ